MRYIEAPEKLPPPLRSWSRCPAVAPAADATPADGPVVFLAGGITGCPDWQADARARFADTNLVVCNPRRVEFDTTDPAAADEQIAWEVMHLRIADLTLFWFPSPSGDVPQPIALFELGMALGDRKCWGRKLVLGVDPDYCRRHDVITQCHYAAPALIVHDQLDEVCAAALTALAPTNPVYFDQPATS